MSDLNEEREKPCKSWSNSLPGWRKSKFKDPEAAACLVEEQFKRNANGFPRCGGFHFSAHPLVLFCLLWVSSLGPGEGRLCFLSQEESQFSIERYPATRSFGEPCTWFCFHSDLLVMHLSLWVVFISPFMPDQLQHPYHLLTVTIIPGLPGWPDLGSGSSWHRLPLRGASSDFIRALEKNQHSLAISNPCQCVIW